MASKDRLDGTSPAASSLTFAVPHDVEGAQHQVPQKISFWRELWDQGAVTQDVVSYNYAGEGTTESPYLVEWLPKDPRNPMAYSAMKKWGIMWVQAGSVLAISFTSSAYSGGVIEIMRDFKVSEEVAILGVAMFVLGFAVGPLLFAPLSELYGRQKISFISIVTLTAFAAGAAASPTMAGLVVFRFLGGAFGSAPLTNAGGVVADMFDASQRGIAISIFSLAPFLGPALGPIAGGFLGEAAGWRWIMGLTAIFCGIFVFVGTFTYPETYGPILLRKRAATLSELTGKVYMAKMDAGKPPLPVGAKLSLFLLRPWVLFFKEPIVLLISVYMAIIYGTLYMFFAAFPIVFQQGRGWSPGIGGLSFVGIAIGMLVSTIATIFIDNPRYAKLVAASPKGTVPPEARLPPTMVGSFLIPISLFWFAWTSGPSVHWVVPIIGSSFFAAGIVLVFLSSMNYIIDSYVIFAASALASTTVLRSVFGAVFPLFTTYMYKNLGIHWASSIPAFLAVACLPFPALFYKYGHVIRARCKYSAEASAFLEKMAAAQQASSTSEEEETSGETETPISKEEK